ncbi:nucleotidyltransferase domain-containing protein [Streptomyces fuscigenes]|uniref:nucleotidyltransferase domain-containing protein n=1 Tax=Streptomyces fuscigenes TaxID=1528880 RepID=UPI001F2A6780|nr:nucleotidyltransferase domain-containing protein [Streptomyces fuscigenes]MCF3964551.1 nucleotidyltransferase [Streptomyces fuscigenes]
MTSDPTRPATPVAPATERLLGRFTAALPPYVTDLWAHGSLAMGDYQEGRSDLDLVAVLAPGTAPDARRREELVSVHRVVARDALARNLHCTYLPAASLGDASLDHLTWAHGEAFERPVTPVTRRELLDAGRVLRGRPPKAVLPLLREGELAAFVRADLRTYWYERAAEPELWSEDIWVTLGVLTMARATVLLREDRLITKGEALAELARMGAPSDVVEDVRALRYDPDPAPAREPWRTRRGELARAFVRAAVERTPGLGEADPVRS